jgi:hypothetical protein
MVFINNLLKFKRDNNKHVLGYFITDLIYDSINSNYLCVSKDNTEDVFIIYPSEILIYTEIDDCISVNIGKYFKDDSYIENITLYEYNNIKLNKLAGKNFQNDYFYRLEKDMIGFDEEIKITDNDTIIKKSILKNIHNIINIKKNGVNDMEILKDYIYFIKLCLKHSDLGLYDILKEDKLPSQEIKYFFKLCVIDN